IAFTNEVATVREQITSIVLQETDLRTTIHNLAMLFLERGPRDMRRLNQDFNNFVSKRQREETFRDVTPEESLIGTLLTCFDRHLAAGELRTDIDLEALIPIVYGMVHAQLNFRERYSANGDEPNRSNLDIADSIVEVLLFGIVPR
ncbi:MAG: hypothetical protein WKF81_12655, partial [Thermomicrobiales bacterium]